MQELRDRQKYQHGLGFQGEARKAFEASLFEEAYPLYKKAEMLYREAFAIARDRCFFMQATALRCLEELLDAGRSDFAQQYQDEYNSFVLEWTEDEIGRRLTTHMNRKVAVSFLFFRKTYSGSAKLLSLATAAVNARDFERGKSSPVSSVTPPRTPDRSHLPCWQ